MMMMMIFHNAYLPSRASLRPRWHRRSWSVRDSPTRSARSPRSPHDAQTRAARRLARLAAAVSVVATWAEHDEMGDPSTARGLRPARHLLEHHPDRDARVGRRRRPQRDVRRQMRHHHQLEFIIDTHDGRVRAPASALRDGGGAGRPGLTASPCRASSTPAASPRPRAPPAPTPSHFTHPPSHTLDTRTPDNARHTHDARALARAPPRSC